MDDTPTPEVSKDVSLDTELEINPQRRKRKLPVRRKRIIIPVDKRTTKRGKSIYAGMTHMNCADGCKPDSCVISGRGYCAHPMKGSLQRLDQNDLGAITRLNEAKEFLGARR